MVFLFCFVFYYGKDTLNSVPREYNFPLKGTEDIFANITQTNYIHLCLKQLIHKTLKCRLQEGSCIQAVFMQKVSDKIIRIISHKILTTEIKTNSCALISQQFT